MPLDLTWRNEKSLTLLERALIALVHLVSEEHLCVIGRGPPALVQGEVSRSGLDQEEDLLSLRVSEGGWGNGKRESVYRMSFRPSTQTSSHIKARQTSEKHVKQVSDISNCPQSLSGQSRTPELHSI